MKKMELSRIVLFLILGLVLTLAVISPVAVIAQGPAGETPTAEPGKPTATEPPTPTSTPVLTPTPTPAGATATVGPTRTPVPSEPVAIPEPITVILFGTGLAALSASAAVRRKKE